MKFINNSAMFVGIKTQVSCMLIFPGLVKPAFATFLFKWQETIPAGKFEGGKYDDVMYYLREDSPFTKCWKKSSEKKNKMDKQIF